VVGAGTIGLLATLAMRLRGLEVTCYSRRLPPYRNSDLINELGAHYVSSQQATMIEASGRFGPFDIIFEASGFSPLVFEAAQALGKNGVLVLSSVTGGDKTANVNADKINQGFVLGNKVMVATVNASRADFVSGVNDLVKAEAFYPGWLNQLPIMHYCQTAVQPRWSAARASSTGYAFPASMDHQFLPACWTSRQATGPSVRLALPR